MLRTLSRYSAGAIGLHWLIAAAILYNEWLGWRMAHTDGFAQFKLFQLHKSVGISVLLLSVARLAWRLTHRPPSHPVHMSANERRIAAAAHWAFYAMMFVLPLTGWVVVSASSYNLPTLLYGTVPWPHVGLIHALPAGTRKLVDARVGVTHVWLAWTLLALVGLHVAAALKHHLFDRDDVLARMLPRLRRPADAERT